MSDRRPDDIFAAALERSADERHAFVRAACGDDMELRREVESLLSAHERAGVFLDTPLGDDQVREALGASGVEDPLIGRRVGAYELLRVIGSGGMGTVYLGRRADAEYEEQVAVKVVRRGLDTDDVLARFRNERQVLANLRHPGIAMLLDGGATEDGRPYLVMEYVDGLPLHAYAFEHALDIRARIALVRDVCAAVEHAHKNLVVHRDLKPSNILVTSDGGVKLLDFGIAKMLTPDGVEEGGLTRTRARLMTPRYASPEQVRGEATTTATDVYALGLIAYELLTGHFPYPVETTSPTELERTILGTDPRPPSAHVRALRGDLDLVLLKALQKDVDRRYASARHFSEDLDRVLDARPVSAQPDSVWYRTRTFVRRNRGSVIAGTAVAVALLVTAVVSTSQYVRASRARDAARIAQLDAEMQRAAAERSGRTAARVSDFLQEMLSSIQPAVARGRDVTLMREIIDEAASRIDEELANEPDVAIELHLTIGRAYDAIAEYPAAEHHLRRALALIERPDGRRPAPLATAAGARRADALLSLGSTLRARGAYADAERALSEAIELLGSAGRPESVQLGIATNRLGGVLEDAGRYVDAERLYREAVAILDRAGGEAEADRLNAQVNLAVLLMNSERHDEAESLLRDVVAERRELEHSPLVLSTTIHNLAGLLRRKGAYEEAETHYRDALAVKRSYLGDDHPDVAVTLNGLATLLELRGELKDAEPLYREALDIQRRALGESHRDAGTTLNNLAGLLRRAGRHDEADTRYVQALDVYRTALGPAHAWVAIVATNRARNLVEAGRHALAESLLVESLALHEQRWPRDHWRVLVTRSLYGEALSGLGRFTEAESLALGSAERLEAALGREADATHDAWRRVVDLYERWGRDPEAAAYRERLAP